MPVRLIKNIIKFLIFISKVGSKDNTRKTTRTYGQNPAVEKQMSEQELYFFEQKINIEQQTRKNTRKGDKNPGFAPHTFELYRCGRDGAASLIKKGVLGYDVDGEGNIVCTNGKYIFGISPSGEEKVLYKDRIIESVSF